MKFTPVRSRLQLHSLENRLAAGDALLSALLGASWLGATLSLPDSVQEPVRVAVLDDSLIHHEVARQAFLPGRNASELPRASAVAVTPAPAAREATDVPAPDWTGSFGDLSSAPATPVRHTHDPLLTSAATRGGVAEFAGIQPPPSLNSGEFSYPSRFDPLADLDLGQLPSGSATGAQGLGPTTLFYDDFEDGAADGWTTYQGSWSVTSDDSLVYRQSGTSSIYRAAAGSPEWADYVVEARVKPTAWNGSDRFAALMGRFQDPNNTYLFALRSSNRVELRKVAAGSSTSLAQSTYTVSLNTSYALKLEVSGTTLRGYVNGILQVTAEDGTFAAGRIGVRTDYASANFDDIVATTGGPPVNQPPQVDAGRDQVVMFPAPAQFAGMVTDDGLPDPPAAVACLWSQTGGPGEVTFKPGPDVLDPQASFDMPGTYTLRLTCSDSELEGFDVVRIAALTEPPPPGDDVIGFASVDAWGQNGTTGGAGGEIVTVTTAGEFLDYIARPGPYVIQVDGMIRLPGPMHNVTSDKTILGLGSESGITGGGLNIGLPNNDSIIEPPPNAVKNVILRNLVFTGFPDDAINVQMFSHHIWIDHNDLSRAYDGLIDIKRGSSYITVSWNHTHHHTKNMLLGHADNNGRQDIGRLKITYHHNWFDATPQRNPRVRFGEPVHVFGNYYVRNSDVGVACQASSGCMVEGNYFDSVEEPMTNRYAGPQGRIVERDNVYVNSGRPVVGGTVEEPGLYYAYQLDDPAEVKTIVMKGAGVGRI